MKFKKGSKVEVFSKKEVPSGAWHCAEIISGNGHNYSVRYEPFLGMISKVDIDRVPRKAIRPCPPPVKGVESWVTDEVVEVFGNGSWKCAMILKVTYGVYYLVRLLGSCHEFEVHKSNIRARQAWKGDKWVMIGQGSISFDDERLKKPLTSDSLQKMSFQVPQSGMKLKLQPGDYFLQQNADFQESPMVSTRRLKRASPYCPSDLEAYSGNFQKMRATENGGLQRVVAGYPSTLQEKGESWRHACLASKGLRMIDMLWVIGVSYVRESKSKNLTGLA